MTRLPYIAVARRIAAGAAALALAASVAGCGQTKATTPAPAEKLKVVVSFFPLYDFARKVGGDRVDVRNLVPAGAEPHDWEPRAGDIKAIGEARVFIFNGAGFEDWVDSVLKAVDNKSLIVVDASQGIQLLEDDPHVWLDPVNNQVQVKAIAAALAQADPAGKSAYQANADALVGRLQQLDRDYAAAFAHCERKEIVVSHAFFAYPARRYGLKQVPIVEGFEPDAEPTPKQIAQLARFAKENQVRYIFFETLVSDKLARTLANEVGAETLVLNPLEGLTEEELSQGRDFLDGMRDNLRNLKKGLGCR